MTIAFLFFYLFFRKNIILDLYFIIYTNKIKKLLLIIYSSIRCASASLYWTHHIDMSDWELVTPTDKNGNFSSLSTYPVENTTTITVSFTNDAFENVYFSAPDTYLDKKFTSYGGHLNYTVYYTTGPFGKAVSAADVILQGANITLFYYADEQPPSFINFRASLSLVEANFVTSGRLSATREQIMVVLEDLSGLYIRATYWNPSITASYVSSNSFKC